jgi:hypothetical protein
MAPAGSAVASVRLRSPDETDDLPAQFDERRRGARLDLVAGLGRSAAISATTRAGGLDRTTTRSLRYTASSMSWVTKRTVLSWAVRDERAC